MLLCLLGFGVIAAFVQAQATDTAAAHPTARQRFRYMGLGREAFHPSMAQWLLKGSYASFARKARAEFPIPGLAAGYVPQGMCYSETLGCFLLTAYYPKGKRPSLLSMVDPATGELIRNVYLLCPDGSIYNGHASAVADDDAGRHTWVTDGSRVYHLLTEDLRTARDEDTVRLRDMFVTGRRGGFALRAEGLLWLGEFASPEREMNPAHREPRTGNRGWCVGYPLNGDAPMGFDPNPAFVLSVPDYAQGACDTGSALYLSTSHGNRNPSWMLVFPPLRKIMRTNDRITVNGISLPFFVLDEGKAHRQVLAPMSEGIAAYDGKIYTLFESAALIYRARAELFADYVYSIPEISH